ncbi:hypothetical protein DFA_07517 [Cavenderia fasciculata]|uniref:Tim44-like domain-containing protein n=1 Tax=Cavenderia fasciculata TaxID=261658 RepID=F4PWM9_CACFS|nr:uncharacterized protein DFA_07517 [Cavenderia fasciculata]EGG20393.1 hypothetical protein DFA_07517 [Cavenderia fasciculata]|eukprot:XP_004367376.1 hypothetical protein DFA_07517 [Cavenderia fasciculata]
MNRLVRSGLVSASRGPTLQTMVSKSSVWYPSMSHTSNVIVSTIDNNNNNNSNNSNSNMLYRQLYSGGSVQIVDENPEYKKSIEDFRKTFLWWRKPQPTEEELKKQQEDEEAAAQAAQAAQHEQHQAQQQQQQESPEGATEGDQKEKVYGSKEEELRDKYKEYYKDYDKRKDEADRINKFRGGNMNAEQTAQLVNAYKETMGTRPPYPPRSRRDYRGCQDLRELAVSHEMLPLPSRVPFTLETYQLDPGYIADREADSFPETIQMLKELEQKLLAEGVELPEIDWDSIDSYEQLELLPSELADTFDKPIDYEPNNVPALYVRSAARFYDSLWERQLDFIHRIFEKIPAFGGNYIYFIMGRISGTIAGFVGGYTSSPALTKFYFDYRDLIMPGFEFNKFLPIAKSKFIPEFLELYFANDVDGLEDFCGETLHKMLSGIIAANEAGHKVFDGKIVKIDTLDFMGINESENREETYFSFLVVVHHTYCIRDYQFEIVEGGDHEIIKTQMIVHMSVDTDLNEFGWCVSKLDVHPSESIYL